MKRNDPPEVLELFDSIESLLTKAIPFEGTIVRSVGVRYANEKDFLSGDGAALVGGRWNPPGIRAVYGSTDIFTATAEAYQGFLEYGFALTSMRPRVTAGAHVKLECVFDLTNAAIRKRLGFTLRELLEEDWKGIQATGIESWTQAIGRGCATLGFEGLFVPSARNPKGNNLVVFPKNLRPGSSIRPIARGDLPPHPTLWS